MLVIRMQRTGRSGHAQFRIVLQDSRQTPSSGRVIAALGNYDPHTKEISVDLEKVKFYLSKGAHPSERVASLLKKEGIKLPTWVTLRSKSKKTVKNIEKLRKNRPAAEPAKEPIVVEAENSSTTDQEKSSAGNENVEVENVVEQKEAPAEIINTEEENK